MFFLAQWFSLFEKGHQYPLVTARKHAQGSGSMAQTCHKETVFPSLRQSSSPPGIQWPQPAQRWAAQDFRDPSLTRERLGSKGGRKTHPDKQKTNHRAHSELHIERRHLTFLVRAHLPVKNSPRRSTPAATPDESGPARAPRPERAMPPPSGQTGSARSGGYWRWGDQPGWPAGGPACRPYCPHRSRSQSPWSPGSNLPSRGTQTRSPSPEAHGLEDKTVNSSPRGHRRCTPSVQSKRLSIHTTRSEA